MGASAIRGMQDIKDDGGVPKRVAACMKHFIAYSDPVNGHDRSPVLLPDRILQQIYRPSFQAAIDAGVLTAMESYQEVGGVPMVSSSKYLRTLLRSSWNMNFQGMMVTDYHEIENLNTWHKVSASEEDATILSISETSIDMSMIPLDVTFIDYLENAVISNKIPESRIDESARRILELKNTLGMFDDPIPSLQDPLVATVGQDADWLASLDSARESMTLLKNSNGVLPLVSTQSVFLTGPSADSLVGQTGGWTFHWQGASSNADFSEGVTVKQAFAAKIDSSLLSFYAGPTFDATDTSGVNMTTAIDLASKASVVVVCIGEGAYAEKPGDIDDLALPAGQVSYIRQIRAAIPTTIPIITVLVEGRPRLLSTVPSDSNGVLMAYVPGPMGGSAIVDVLYGTANPSGRLPYTYPQKAADIPYTYDHKPGDQCNYGPCTPEWAFGTGLSYSTFAYTGSTINGNSFDENGEITVQTTVTNTGAVAGSHSVLLFFFDLYRRVTPEYKQLKRFAKVTLGAGESTTVTFSLPVSELKYIGMDSRYILEGGEYLVAVGPDTDCRSDSSNCLSFSLDLSSSYNPVCDMACDTEMYSQAMATCKSSDDNSITNCRTLCTTQAWSWNYVDCLENTANGIQACYNNAPQCYSPTAAANPEAAVACNADDSSVETSYFYMFVGISVVCGAIFGVLATYFSVKLGFFRVSSSNNRQYDEEKSSSRGTSAGPIMRPEQVYSTIAPGDESRAALLERSRNNI